MSQLNIFNETVPQAGLPVGLMDYQPGFINKMAADSLLSTFITTVQWKQSTRIMWGKEVLTPRLTAWFGKREHHILSAFPWTKELLAIKALVEPACGLTFNSALLNYYRDSNDSVAWHADDEPELGTNPVIASVNFGQVRRFDVRYKSNHDVKYSVELGHGSLLVMKGDLQHNWEHRVAKSAKPMKARINLTFRATR